MSPWPRHLAPPDPDQHWPLLAQAVADCFDHQSEKATDCRWLKLMYKLAMGKFHLPIDAGEMALEIVEYPTRGDMRKVRPFIRATEMALRGGPAGFEAPGAWNNEFWEDCWQNTACNIPAPRALTSQSHRGTSEALLDLYKQVTEHFHSSMPGTLLDARHDGAFGLVLYGVYCAMSLCRGNISFRAEARIVLRTLVEAFITLKYLSFKDDPTIWMQYRNFGVGQAKLSFLKHITSDDVPDYIDLEDLEMHSNADMWMEYQDINVGAWANKNLRTMATEARAKEIYDKYYDWPSGFVHANWSAVRDTTFEQCLNPLHRFHRVASFPRIDMNDVLIDAGKLVNLLLDELNKLYPSFKPRLKKEDFPVASNEADK